MKGHDKSWLYQVRVGYSVSKKKSKKIKYIQHMAAAFWLEGHSAIGVPNWQNKVRWMEIVICY